MVGKVSIPSLVDNISSLTEQIADDLREVMATDQAVVFSAPPMFQTTWWHMSISGVHQPFGRNSAQTSSSSGEPDYDPYIYRD
jgi:hypothetical protein